MDQCPSLIRRGEAREEVLRKNLQFQSQSKVELRSFWRERKGSWGWRETKIKQHLAGGDASWREMEVFPDGRVYKVEPSGTLCHSVR